MKTLLVRVSCIQNTQVRIKTIAKVFGKVDTFWTYLWLMISLSRCIAIGSCKFCDEHVQLQYYKNTGEIVIGRNWPDVVYKYSLEEDDYLVFKLTATGFKMDIYKNMDSTARDTLVLSTISSSVLKVTTF